MFCSSSINLNSIWLWHKKQPNLVNTDMEKNFNRVQPDHIVQYVNTSLRVQLKKSRIGIKSQVRLNWNTGTYYWDYLDKTTKGWARLACYNYIGEFYLQFFAGGEGGSPARPLLGNCQPKNWDNVLVKDYAPPCPAPSTLPETPYSYIHY